MPGQSSPATKISLFTNENARFCDPPHPPGGRAAPPCLVSPGSQTTKLSPPTLLDGSLPGFSSTGEASLPAIAGRQAKKFCFKLDTVFINSDIYNFPCIMHQRFWLSPLLLFNFSFTVSINFKGWLHSTAAGACYVITCQSCHKLYISEPGRRLSDCFVTPPAFGGGLQIDPTDRGFPVAESFNLLAHNLVHDMQVSVVR